MIDMDEWRGKEDEGRGDLVKEIEMGVRWPCLSKSTICCQIARHCEYGQRSSTHTHTCIYIHKYTHSKPHMSLNMYADGQAVTQSAPKRAWSG